MIRVFYSRAYPPADTVHCDGLLVYTNILRSEIHHGIGTPTRPWCLSVKKILNHSIPLKYMYMYLQTPALFTANVRLTLSPPPSFRFMVKRLWWGKPAYRNFYFVLLISLRNNAGHYILRFAVELVNCWTAEPACTVVRRSEIQNGSVLKSMCHCFQFCFFNFRIRYIGFSRHRSQVIYTLSLHVFVYLTIIVVINRPIIHHEFHGYWIHLAISVSHLSDSVSVLWNCDQFI